MATTNVIRLNNTGDLMSLNLTPVIDIVFQLIIFFAVTCQFIEAENFPVSVPDNCTFASAVDQPGSQITTVTVIKDGLGGKSVFAVGSEKVAASNYEQTADKLTLLLNAQLKDLPAQKRVVTLRIDKDVPFAEAQYALSAIAASSASDIRLAAFRENLPESQ
jgi:biopolymer transport protein ExbD